MVDLTLLFLHRNIVSISHFIKFEKKNLFSILKAVARALIVKKKKFAAHNAYSDKVYVVLEKKNGNENQFFPLSRSLCESRCRRRNVCTDRLWRSQVQCLCIEILDRVENRIGMSELRRVFSASSRDEMFACI